MVIFVGCGMGGGGCQNKRKIYSVSANLGYLKQLYYFFLISPPKNLHYPSISRGGVNIEEKNRFIFLLVRSIVDSMPNFSFLDCVILTIPAHGAINLGWISRVLEDPMPQGQAAS